jgi:hypothetical protein
MDEFFSLFGVNRVLRKGARLMRGMRFDLNDDALSVTQVCALRWLSVTEEFPLKPGAVREHKRRDMRRGVQTGGLAKAADGVVRLEVAWGAPLGGCAVDEIRLVPTAKGREKLLAREKEARGRRRGGGGAEEGEQARFLTTPGRGSSGGSSGGGLRGASTASLSLSSGGGGGRSGGSSVSSGGGADPASSGVKFADGDYELHGTSTAWVDGQKARFKWVCVKRG